VVEGLLSTVAAMALALLVAASLGPPLGRWSTHHRLARFLVGLLTELRMLPILVALVPLLAARSGLPAFVIIGLFAGASRSATLARWTAHVETSQRAFGAWTPARSGPKRAAARLTAASEASCLQVTFEVALLEGLNTFFSEGRGPGLGAELARGHFGAVVPLVALAWLVTTLLERPALRPWRRATR